MGTNGLFYSTRSLLDNGSQVNLITHAVIQQLNVKMHPDQTTFLGLGGNILGSSMGEVRLNLKLKNGEHINDRFYVVKTITSYRPDTQDDKWNHVKEVLADEEYNKPGKINALLGVGIWVKIIEPEVLRMGKFAIAQKTKLGYVIFESRQDPYVVEEPYIGSISKGASVKKLMEMIQRLWEVEEIPHTKKRSREEEICEQIFMERHTRDKAGRYIIRIPFNNQVKLLGKSKKMALHQFFAMESRMKKNAEFGIKYKLFMSEYEALGHMEQVGASMG